MNSFKSIGSHWVIVSTIGATHPTVHIYDSLFSQAGTKLQAQLAALLATNKEEILVY